jgi:hypothetical protein
MLAGMGRAHAYRASVSSLLHTLDEKIDPSPHEWHQMKVQHPLMSISRRAPHCASRFRHRTAVAVAMADGLQ